MVITGCARKICTDVRAWQIIPPAAAASGDPAELAALCLATVDPHLAERVREGDVLVIDGVITDGADLEAAVLALQALGLAALICKDAEPALIALGAQYGLPILVAPAAAAAISEGALLRLDLERGIVESAGARWSAPPLSPEALAVVRRVTLLARMRRVVEDEGLAEG